VKISPRLGAPVEVSPGWGRLMSERRIAPHFKLVSVEKPTLMLTTFDRDVEIAVSRVASLARLAGSPLFRQPSLMDEGKDS
jgi:hypothetical protein